MEKKINVSKGTFLFSETATIAASLSTTVRSMESFGCVQIAG